MQPQSTSTLTATQRDALRGKQTQALAALAAQWAVEAVGRRYPTHHIRDGYRYVRTGKWYVVRGDERIPATAVQSRALHRAACDLGGAYGSIHVCAAVD